MGAGHRQGTHVTLMHKDGTDVGVSAEWQLVMHPSFSSPSASRETESQGEKVCSANSELT